MQKTLIIMSLALAALAVVAALLYPRPVAAQPGVGDPAPAFSLTDQNGETHTLAGFSGKWLVLYFYPKDDTPGCTTEACNFRDDIFKFKEAGIAIAGVSLDDVESHKAFAEKYSLPFPLLADSDHAVAEAYGVLTSMGPVKFAKRETFIIGPDGKVAKHYGKVDPDEHSAEVLADVKAMMGDAQG